MKKIERYIFVHLTKFTSIVLAALVFLLTLVRLSREVRQIGQGDYTLKTLVVYTSLALPSYVYEMFPFAVLIGVMIAMTQFVQTSEYAVMRTLGVSVWRVTRVLCVFGLSCGLLVFFLGDYLVPKTKQEADRVRMLAKHRPIVSRGGVTGIWAKDGRQFVQIGEMLPDGSLLELKIYSRSKDHRLLSSIMADKAVYDHQLHLWQLKNIKESRLQDRSVVRVNRPHGVWHTSLRPEIMSALVSTPEQMSSWAMLKYMTHLSQNKQKTRRYELALWSRWFYPLSCVVMACFALMFIPHLPRHGILAKRIMLGVLFGLSYYLLNRLVIQLGFFYQWSAPLVTIMPMMMFALIAWLGIWMQERR